MTGSATASVGRESNVQGGRCHWRDERDQIDFAGSGRVARPDGFEEGRGERREDRGRRWNTANALAVCTIEAVPQSRLTEKFWNLMRPSH